MCVLLYPADVSVLFFIFLVAVSYPSSFSSNNKIQSIRLTEFQAYCRLLYVTLLREKLLKLPPFSAKFVFICIKSYKSREITF